MKNKMVSLILGLVLVLGLKNGTVQAKELKYTVHEDIVICESSHYNPEIGLFESILITENDVKYHVWSDNNLTNEWFVILVESEANSTYEDMVIGMYNLDNYVFGTSE